MENNTGAPVASPTTNTGVPVNTGSPVASGTSTTPSKPQTMEDIKASIDSELNTDVTGNSSTPPQEETQTPQDGNVSVKASDEPGPQANQDDKSHGEKPKRDASFRIKQLSDKLKEKDTAFQEAQLRNLQLQKQLEYVQSLYQQEAPRLKQLDQHLTPEARELAQMRQNEALRQKQAEFQQAQAKMLNEERARIQKEQAQILHTERVESFTNEFNHTADRMGFDANERVMLAKLVHEDVKSGKNTPLENLAKSVQDHLMSKYESKVLEKHKVALNAPRPMGAHGTVRPQAKPQSLEDIRQSIFDELEAQGHY
jgi:hypothetical protein